MHFAGDTSFATIAANGHGAMRPTIATPRAHERWRDRRGEAVTKVFALLVLECQTAIWETQEMLNVHRSRQTAVYVDFAGLRVLAAFQSCFFRELFSSASE